MSFEQLTLNVTLKEGLRFESFFVEEGSANSDILKILQSFVASSKQQQNIIWGESLCGKTHLLQACCAKEAKNNQFVSYIPLKVLNIHGPEVLQGMSNSNLVVIDDVDSVIGDRAWETALFNLINQIRDNNQRLLLSSQKNPRKLSCVLPDLASRLIWIEYLFRYYPRDIESLMDILNKLDEESLKQKTKITIPFVKQVLE